ncbi:MAG: HAMP domain-containing sensor histidine kinase [Oscillospiraceae bacterium]|nr:HAMP domain-containing sensor histidine kinase [Oscillospiraceae bacterium]
MLKKLRKKFIFSNMFLVSIIILLVFSSLFFSNYYRERRESLDALQAVANNTILNYEINKHKYVGNLNFSEYVPLSNAVSTVAVLSQVDKYGNILAYGVSGNVTASKELINKAINHAYKSSSSDGVISGMGVRFLKVENKVGGYNIAIADITAENATLAFLFRAYLIGALFILAIMFLISDYMAFKAISPVEKSWKNQNRFVADASHELKTPLTVILANMDIISSNPNATIEEQKKWIENTKSEATRMTDLINDMLFLAKSDAAVEQSLNTMEVNLSNLCEECALTFEAVAFERGVTLNSAIAPNVIARVDEAKMKQAIIILLDNAIKYVDDSGVITLALETNSKNIKISVFNTGDPIPLDKQKHIFERFFRAEESRARDRGGYGLGLSIAGNIMQAHKGRLDLEYSDSRGTCFNLIVPAIKQSIVKKRKTT